MRQVVDEFSDKVIIGEVYLPIQRLMAYYGHDNRGAHLPFNFQLIQLPWNAQDIATAIDQYEGALPGESWPNWVLSNHDRPRIASRVGEAQARIAAMLLLTLRGTPTLYYGDEIGMRDEPIPIDEIVDPQGLNMPEKDLSRDPARTPMQWDEGLYAGFSNAKPWLRIARNYARVNVERLRQDPYSMLVLHHKLLKLRNQEPALQLGTYTPVFSDQQVIAYQRDYPGADSFLIILNLTPRPSRFRQPEHTPLRKGTVVIASDPEFEGQAIEGNAYLHGDDGIIVRLAHHEQK